MKREENNMKRVKKVLSVMVLSGMLLSTNAQAATGTEYAKAGGATVVGTAAGYGVAVTSGMSACSIVGGGMGLGAAAGPIGAAVGALTGRAVYGGYKVFDDEGGK
jgi:DNA-binding beta-propeller fold protein YncE